MYAFASNGHSFHQYTAWSRTILQIVDRPKELRQPAHTMTHTHSLAPTCPSTPLLIHPCISLQRDYILQDHLFHLVPLDRCMISPESGSRYRLYLPLLPPPLVKHRHLYFPSAAIRLPDISHPQSALPDAITGHHPCQLIAYGASTGFQPTAPFAP